MPTWKLNSPLWHIHASTEEPLRYVWTPPPLFLRAQLTGIVRLPCKLLMAAWASACPWNFTNAQPVIKKTKQNTLVKKVWFNEAEVRDIFLFCGRSPTFAGAIWSPQHSALVYAAKRLKQPPDILIALLLSQHAHKQLPVLCGNKDARDLKSGHTSAVQTVNTVSTDRDVSMKACFFFSLSLSPPGSSVAQWEKVYKARNHFITDLIDTWLCCCICSLFVPGSVKVN